MARDLILHVGMDKTGTTAIQHYLYTRRDRLAAEDGVLMPLAGMWSDHSHHHFAFAAMGMAGHSPEDLDGLFAALAEEAEASPASRVLLSSECLFKLPNRFPDSPFWSHLERRFGQVRVVVYVRRQDTWIESRYRHSVISGRELPTSMLAMPGFSDYKRFIDDWANRLGREAVTVRPYERSQFAGGDIAQDFRAAIGLGPDEEGRSALRNETFGSDDVLFRATANHLGLPEASLHRLNAVLLVRPQGDAPDRTMLSPEHAELLVSHYRPVNAAIARDYLGRSDGVLFRDPLPAADPGWRPPLLATEGFAAILGFVAACDEALGHAIAAAARALPGEGAESDPAAALSRLHERLRSEAPAPLPPHILQRRPIPGQPRPAAQVTAAR